MELKKFDQFAVNENDWRSSDYDHKRDFTMDKALAVQREQLANWKTKLNSVCYHDLEKAALLSNEGKTNPDSIARGSSLSSFIANWKPGKSLEELAWTLKN